MTLTRRALVALAIVAGAVALAAAVLSRRQELDEHGIRSKPRRAASSASIRCYRGGSPT